MSDGSIVRSRESKLTSSSWIPVLQIAVAILLPGVGFLANEVISNGRELARLEGAVVTHQQLLEALRTHADRPHHGAVTRNEIVQLMAALERRLDRIEAKLDGKP